MLSNLGVNHISAGESHSAAITKNKRVYFWGNGSFGRLGTGFEYNQIEPTRVDDLDDKEIVNISCGAFHTLVLSRDGTMYSFGQNKYGKLGIKENF